MLGRLSSLLVVPLLLAALPAFAQTQDSASGTTTSNAKSAVPPTSSQSNTPVTPSEKKKPNKVWTNDEIGSVKGPVSVVGDSRRSKTNLGNNQSDNFDNSEEEHEQRVADCRNQIANLQSRIEAIDKRIAQLKNFKAENTSPSGGINPYQGYNMVPVEDQVKQLEDRKKQIQASIDDIENEARKNGIDPGELR